MNGKRILLSGAYLELLRAAIGNEIVDASDFPRFLNSLKDKLRHAGRDEVFNALIREEIRMFETKDELV